MKSASESNEVVRRVAKFYSAYWETKRKTELAQIARNLQSEVDGFPNPIDKVEKTLRGKFDILSAKTSTTTLSIIYIQLVKIGLLVVRVGLWDGLIPQNL